MGAPMSVPAGREPAVELARSWRGPWSRTDPAATLAVARHIAAELADGLSGPRVRAAARGVRRLLDVDGVGLADLSGIPIWAGSMPAGDAAEILVRQVLSAETRAGRPPLVALPLYVQDELAGVLLVHGNARRAAVQQA